MKEKPLIVTAFFDLNRKNWKTHTRDSQRYLQYFEFWAGIDNDLIIYTSIEYYDLIKNIREIKGRLIKTKIIIISDYREIDRHLYEEINKCMLDRKALDFKINKNIPESYNADYNYITCLKPWFINNASQIYKEKNVIAWMDFGYNHGGELIINEDDFNFEWIYDNKNKVQLYLIRKLSNLPAFEIVRQASTSVMGALIIVPRELSEEFWKISRNVSLSLAFCGLADDDQTMLEMGIRVNPELFHCELSYWHKPIIDAGAKHMEYKYPKKAKLWKRPLIKLYTYIFSINTKLYYCYKTFKNI